MGRLEWVTEVKEIHVDPDEPYGSTIEDLNEALSKGWRLLEVYPYSRHPRSRAATATVYVLGKAEEGEGAKESTSHQG